MWMPKVDPIIMKEFGDDAVFFRKALANLGEGYGIGACAYLRPLIEKYINPLLELLYELKQQEGASQEDLDKIQEVIRERLHIKNQIRVRNRTRSNNSTEHESVKNLA